jgi:hypothetical protein
VSKIDKLAPQDEVEDNREQDADNDRGDDREKDGHGAALDDDVAGQSAQTIETRDAGRDQDDATDRGDQETSNEEEAPGAGEVSHGAVDLLLDALVDSGGDAEDDHEEGGQDHDDRNQNDDGYPALDDADQPLWH